MGLKEQLESDLKSALKGGKTEEITLLRFVLAQVHNREIEQRTKKGKPDLTEEEVIGVLQKELKKRKEAIDLFKQGGRDDLVKREEQEAALIGHYVPSPLTKEDVGALVDKALAGGAREFSVVMKKVMEEAKGRADGRLVSEVVKEKLSV